MELKKILFSVLLGLLGASLYAQERIELKSESAFVAIIVSDIQASLKWYKQVFNLDEENFVNMPSRGFKQANLKNAYLHLELIELNSALAWSELLKDQPPKSKIQGLFKFGLKVSAFDDWIAHLEKQKVEFNGRVVEDKDSTRMVIVLDPDGNRIQFFEKRWNEEQEAIKQLFETTYLPVVYGDSDPNLLANGFHPEFNMYVNHKGRFFKRTLAEWKSNLEKNRGKSPAEYEIEFEDIDVTETTAFVKLIVYADGDLKYTDYLTLYKMDSKWQVFTKLFTIH